MIKPNYVFLFAFLFFLINLPNHISDELRNSAITCISPFWKVFSSSSNNVSKEETQNKNLILENQKLKTQIEAVKEWLQFDQRIEEQIERYLSLKQKGNDLYWREFFRRRGEDLSRLIDLQMQALPANVIFREPNVWSSSMWIDLGEKDNEKMGRKIISKNSPVVSGNALVGIIEYVSERKSRVRLITDSGLIPAVRAVRGEIANTELLRILNLFLDRIQVQQDIFDNEDEYSIFISDLKKIQYKLSVSENNYFLAKGQIMGGSFPLWRCYQNRLKGVGFNYDYQDQEGPARELRSGKIIGEHRSLSEMPIIKKGDLLITSGMDGVFPPGLHVATVSKVDDLEDGSYSYSLEAIPSAENLNELGVVFVLPPVIE